MPTLPGVPLLVAMARTVSTPLLAASSRRRALPWPTGSSPPSAPEAIDRIARTVGDAEVDTPVSRRIPPLKCANGANDGFPLASLFDVRAALFGPIVVIPRPWRTDVLD
jgi:hypothetical protein